jgi:hypothetical protein
MHAHTKTILAVGTSIAIMTSLSGCLILPPSTPASTDSAPTPVEGESSSPTPTPTPVAVSDVLFTITAEVTDTAGEVVSLTMTGHQPQVSTAAGRESIRDTYISECNARGGGSTSDYAAGTIDPSMLEGFGSTLMVIDIDSSPAGRTFSAPLSLRLGSGFYYQVVTGDGVDHLRSTGCYADAELVGSGTATGITNYETGYGTPDPTQWQNGQYGFSIDHGRGSLEHCEITLTPLAIDSGVESVPGWEPGGTSARFCAIGYLGE